MQGSSHSGQAFESAASGLPGGWGPQYERQRYGGQPMPPGEATLQSLRDYARERPEVVALWAFGLGFVLGWRLKPW